MSGEGWGPGVFSRLYWRRLGLGVRTVLGLRPRGFFIPYRHADAVPGPGARPTYPAMAAMLAAAEENYRAVLAAIEAHAAALLAIGDQPPPGPRWNQKWFPPLDGAVAYTLIREGAPARLVEVGSGHSTRFFARAVADGNLATSITAIDPAPRAEIGKLHIERIRETLQRAGQGPFAALRSGDVLSIDSSHILMPGTDVDFLLNRILPALPSGARVHIHDVFLPDDYPAAWAWRCYNEQLGVAALLQGGGWRVLWASRYVSTRLAANLETSVTRRLGWEPGGLESSLWIEKT